MIKHLFCLAILPLVLVGCTTLSAGKRPNRTPAPTVSTGNLGKHITDVQEALSKATSRAERIRILSEQLDDKAVKIVEEADRL